MTNDAAAFPLSFAQRRLWFLEQLEPGNTFYNLPLAVPLNFAVNVAVLERSINEIVGRHEALRTVFDTIDGEPMQLVCEPFPLPLTVVDFRALPKDEQDAETARLTAELAQRPFDLGRGPLLRAALIRRGAQDNVFVLVMHHIVSDGWSLGIFWRELIALYNAFYMGGPSPLPELPIQYADFAVWQREELQGERLARLVDYWKRRLADLPVLALPTDRPRPPVLSYRGAVQELTLPRGLTGALRALSQREGATLFMTLFSAFAVVLQRYSGQDDIAVGLPSASRNHKELEGLIGFFINSLVLRADLSGDPTFRELLTRIREIALDAYAHQELPFEKLVEELQPERDLSRNPLFQVSFQLFSVPGERAQAGQAEAAPAVSVNRGSAIFDLAVNLWEAPEEIGGQLEFSTDLFDAPTVARLAGHFKTMLKSIAANPDARLSELQLLGDAELHKMLFEWNDTQMPIPPFCLHELFEQQAEQRPQAVAVADGAEMLTYRETNGRANRLAHRMLAMGVERGDLVCVCLERGTSLVVSLLAVLKAGAAYVPLDPGYPGERLAFMMADSGAKLLLSTSAIASRLGAVLAPALLLDDEAAFEGMSDVNPGLGVTPEDLCYTIYTSGSTGEPKGVAVPHCGLMNLVAWHRQAFAVSSSDRASQLASVAFDACTWEIWPYLASGASLHVIADDVRGSPPTLIRTLIDKKITIGFLPTPLAQIVFEDPACIGLEMRYLLTGGDKLTRPAPSGSDFVVVNNYGPTEYSVVTTSCVLGKHQSLLPPIGRPIANTQVYVLDSHRKPVPIGVAGELYIGGLGLARGYHNRPALTSQSFVANSIPGTPGERLYKTGDLVRYRADGMLEFLGRKDHQVKIRGFRVELGEIESALTAHDGVREALVMVLPQAGDSGRLVAYVAPQEFRRDGNGTSPDIADGYELVAILRGYLRARLPEFMVPGDFVVLSHLPQTPNGKIDRRALPSPQAARDATGGSYTAPRTPLEEVVASIWGEILDVERVGIDDNFFEVGGHSLLAARLISRVRDWLKVEVPLKTLFRFPTPAQFAANLIATAPNPAAIEKTAKLILSLSDISDAEARQMLARPSPPIDESIRP
ncbi:MAG: amino acid adenylation domain-containing protein [Rhizomicrobium sp.]